MASVSFCLSVCVNNAWRLYRLCPSNEIEKLDLLNFTRRIVLTYLQRQSLGARKEGTRMPATEALSDKRVLLEVRSDGRENLIESIIKQRCCGVREESAKTVQEMWHCIALHVNCFRKYQTK